MPEAAARAPAPRIPERLHAAGFWPALGFGMLAIVADELERLPADVPTLLRPGGLAHFAQLRLQRMGAELVLVLIVLLALLATGRTRAELVAQPARSLAVLLGAASVGLVAMTTAGVAWAPHRPPGLPGLPWQAMLQSWSTLLMWGVLWGWLFVQHLRQREDDRQLALLLGRRAALARRVLEARLVRARAQVDPAMIAQVLRRVRAQALGAGAACADGAGAPIALIDHLAGYLRLLLQRVRDAAPSLAGDLELLRALVTLYAAQDARSIELAVAAPLQARAARPAGASFLVARLLLDAALAAGGRAPLRLALATRGDDALAIELAWAADAAVPPSPQALAAALAPLQPGLALQVRHDPQGRPLVVAHVPLR